MDTACPARWQEALDRLARTDFHVLVPGHGAPMTRVDVETYRAAFAALVACGTSTRERRACADGWLKDAAPLLGATDPRFVRSLVDFDVDNHLRGDAKRDAALCGASADHRVDFAACTDTSSSWS